MRRFRNRRKQNRKQRIQTRNFRKQIQQQRNTWHNIQKMNFTKQNDRIAQALYTWHWISNTNYTVLNIRLFKSCYNATHGSSNWFSTNRLNTAYSTLYTNSESSKHHVILIVQWSDITLLKTTHHFVLLWSTWCSTRRTQQRTWNSLQFWPQKKYCIHTHQNENLKTWNKIHNAQNKIQIWTPPILDTRCWRL